MQYLKRNAKYSILVFLLIVLSITVSCILLVTYYLSRKDVNMILDEFVVG